MKTRKQEETVREALYYFLEPHIIRDSAFEHHYEHYWSVGRIWLKLKTCVEKAFGNESEEPEEEYISNLLDHIAAYLLRISLEELIALAFTASSLAKMLDLTARSRQKFYEFKHCLLNIAIMQCEWKDRIVYSPQDHNDHQEDKDKPFLLIAPDQVNLGNLSLKFMIRRSLILSGSKELILGYAKNYLAAFHLPRMHLYETTAQVVEGYEIGKITPTN